MSPAGACYYHPSPFGSGPPVWGCDLGTFPDPPTLLIDAFYVLAGLGIAFGLVLLVLGRNPLPAGPKPMRSALAIRLQALSVIVAGFLLLAATAAVAQSRDHVADPRLSLVSVVAFPLMAGLWIWAWSVDRRARGPMSKA